MFSDGAPTDWDVSKTTAARWTRWYRTNRTQFANLEHRFDSGWNLSAGLARTIATGVDGSAVNSWAPRTQLHLFTTHRLPGDWQRLTVGGGLQWQNRSYYPLPTRAGDTLYQQNASGIVNLMLRYAFSPQLSLQANLNNLLDRKYYANIGGQGQFGTPRNAQVALNFRF